MPGPPFRMRGASGTSDERPSNPSDVAGREPLDRLPARPHGGSLARAPRLRGAVFDLFHTLVDPEELRPPGFSRVREVALAIGAAPQEFDAFWRQCTHERNTTLTSPGSLVGRYCRQAGLKADVGLLARCEHMLSVYQDAAIRTPRSSVLSELSRLRQAGVRTAILTDADQAEIRSLGASALGRLTDAICASCETGVLKPSPEAYAGAFRSLGLSPAECAYAGDGGSDELQGARRAGAGLTILVEAFVAANGMRSREWLRDARRCADLSAATHGQVVDAILERATDAT